MPWPDDYEPCPKKPGGQHKPAESYDPTNERIMELEAKVLHLTNERNREHAKVKANAKVDGLFKAVVKEIDQPGDSLQGPPAGSANPSKGRDQRALRPSH